MGRIVLFTTASCKHCKRAKGILEKYEVPIHEVNLLQYPARKEEMLQLSGGKRTVPQIFFNAEHIGVGTLSHPSPYHSCHRPLAVWLEGL